MKNTVEKYIEFCEGLKFGIGESIALANAEDIIRYGYKYLAGELDDKKLIVFMEGCGCPNENFKEYQDPCFGQSEYCCKKCWEQFLKDN